MHIFRPLRHPNLLSFSVYLKELASESEVTKANQSVIIIVPGCHLNLQWKYSQEKLSQVNKITKFI